VVIPKPTMMRTKPTARFQVSIPGIGYLAELRYVVTIQARPVTISVSIVGASHRGLGLGFADAGGGVKVGFLRDRDSGTGRLLMERGRHLGAATDVD